MSFLNITTRPINGQQTQTISSPQLDQAFQTFFDKYNIVEYGRVLVQMNNLTRLEKVERSKDDPFYTPTKTTMEVPSEEAVLVDRLEDILPMIKIAEKIYDELIAIPITEDKYKQYCSIFLSGGGRNLGNQFSALMNIFFGIANMTMNWLVALARLSSFNNISLHDIVIYDTRLPKLKVAGGYGWVCFDDRRIGHPRLTTTTYIGTTVMSGCLADALATENTSGRINWGPIMAALNRGKRTGERIATDGINQIRAANERLSKIELTPSSGSYDDTPKPPIVPAVIPSESRTQAALSGVSAAVTSRTSPGSDPEEETVWS
jgi:hypothetical protein